MSYGSYSSYGGYTGDRVPGARREKLKGYLRAANELRQSYQDTISQKLAESGDERMPGDFPDVEIVRNGEEEMLLFPSYARRHHTRRGAVDQGDSHPQPGAREGVEGLASSGDADYWKREWERYEDANAIVDVDVRGWIYTPQRGPLSRKSRLLIAVARRLSGIPAPTNSPMGSRESSPRPDNRRRGAVSDETTNKHEDAAADREAANIAMRGEKEAAAAAQGTYATTGNTPWHEDNLRVNSANISRDPSPLGKGGNSSGLDSELNTDDEDPGQFSLVKRSSWAQSANMSREEQLKANDLLMTRLRPFMHQPLALTTITVFFFNDNKSISKSVTTNESGHFNVRAALDFVPSQVRVLASENLSATEDVIISDARGVSLISDIDDTIKHSAIASGAREIFKNTFIRELSDLTIKGVKEWYTRMANMGVQMHYVSNSPWQLFPLLKSYFKLAGIPPGSFHLKQYTGMLQGIFEPAAERKKGSLDRIMSDFPERKFVLVGDSGEADLEVYTDVVLAHPGKVLAVFIRDVTTASKQGFFDSAIFSSAPQTREHSLGPHSDKPEGRPALPTRTKTYSEKPPQPADLIDFSEEPERPPLHESKTATYTDDLQQLSHKPAAQAPTKPAKPSNLRNFATSTPASPGNTSHDRKESAAKDDSAKKRPPPPRPRRSSKSIDTSQAPVFAGAFSSAATTPSAGRHASEPSQYSEYFPERLHRSNTGTTMKSAPPGNEEGYAAAAKRQMNTAYNALPAVRSQSPSRESSTAPPPPPRRGLSSYPAAAARYVTGASGGDPAAGGDGGMPGQPYNKKEEMWKRRWARSRDIMRQQGVMLKTWRVGSDVMEDAVRVVEKAMREMGVNPKEQKQQIEQQQQECEMPKASKVRQGG